MSFTKGGIGERFVIQLFTEAGIEAVKNQDLTQKYDNDLLCKIGNKKFTCEVKYDWLADKTGNLAIEHHNSKQDKPSGISVTKADLWVHVIRDGENNTAWVTTVANLKKFVETKEPFKKIVAGGDKNSNMYLYRVDDILPTFVKIDAMTPEEVSTAIKKLLKEK